MKSFKLMFLLTILSAFVFTSCLKLKEDMQYTAEKEQSDLRSYLENLSSKGYDIDTTALGVYYIILKEGVGDYPQQGDTLSVKYAGYLMNGNIFDTSFYASADSSWTYVYKEAKLLASWDEITGMMNKGCKMEFVIPSSLAYGSTGAGFVPPYSSLIFVAVMSDIRKKQ